MFFILSALQKRLCDATSLELAAIGQYDIMGNLRHFVMLKVVTGLPRDFFYLVWW